MGKHEIEAFLIHLAVNHNISFSTQNQALNSLLFLNEQVFHVEADMDIMAIRTRQSQRLPVVLSREQVSQIITLMNDKTQLMTKLIYGCVLRSPEVVRLRIQDIDFDQKQIIVREAKGNKGRATFSPRNLVVAN
jgi:integrase